MLEELTEALEVFLDITPEDVDEVVPRTRRTVNREKVTDHHAILPTRSMLQADLDALPKGEQNVLKLIIARTLMAVSKPFRYLETLLTTECAGEEFTAKGKEVLEETTTAIELAPEGTGYRARTRFAKFFNLPELMSMFKEVADIKTSDQLHLPVPEAKFETVVAKPSEIQKEMVQELSKRAAEIHSGAVDASVDNMLCVTNDGRKIGLDVHLMNPMLPDDPNSKLNVCVQNVLKIWEEGKDQKLTQLLFCDLSTPKNDGNFNVYDDIRKKLVAAGVPENEIEFIHNADTEAKKAALFSKVRSGDVRVLLGSTAKMGAGTNVQSRLVAVHHLDVGWKPSDMTQRNGRIIRQGNMNKEVKVFNYVTEGTFDSYLFQTLENKQRFISQIMTSTFPTMASHCCTFRKNEKTPSFTFPTPWKSTAGKLALHTTVHGKSGDPTALPMMAGSGWRNTTQTHWKKPIEAFPVTSIRQKR